MKVIPSYHLVFTKRWPEIRYGLFTGTIRQQRTQQEIVKGTTGLVNFILEPFHGMKRLKIDKFFWYLFM